jgi:hypothetical protein
MPSYLTKSVVLVCLVVTSCARDRNVRTTRLVVDDTSFNTYPAALVSLDRAEVIPLPERLEDMKATAADLWIEPGDPELAAITAEGAAQLFSGRAHLGHDVRIASVAFDYDSITTVPSGLTWLTRPHTDDIKSGGVFIVQSSGDRYYKLRIDAWRRGSRPSAGTAANDDKPSAATHMGGFVQLSFAPLRVQ